MRGISVRLCVVAATMLPLAAMGVLAAPASAGTARTTCSGGSATITLSPGLTDSPKVQTVRVKGSLSGCTNQVASAKFTASLRTAEAVTCGALSGAGAPASGAISMTWLPRSSGESKGTLDIPLTETPEASFGGTLPEGRFPGATLTGTLSEAFTDSTECGVGNGKIKPKPVKDGHAAIGSTAVQG